MNLTVHRSGLRPVFGPLTRVCGPPRRPDQSAVKESLNGAMHCGCSGTVHMTIDLRGPARLGQQQLHVTDPSLGEAALAVGEVQRPQPVKAFVVPELFKF